MQQAVTFVGLDVHKATIAVALADSGRRETARFLGDIENTPAGVARLARKLGGKGVRLSFCYEAGPCGYGVYRQLTALGHECIVVAPSLIPRRPGERVNGAMRPAWHSSIVPAS